MRGGYRRPFAPPLLRSSGSARPAGTPAFHDLAVMLHGAPTSPLARIDLPEMVDEVADNLALCPVVEWD